ncbi:hypothetical protein JTB14_038217 [Gonioctena quinquepunctata]|nr:hypothetical protein JTB14_038217 [Gonioctena quinquepunctata]
MVDPDFYLVIGDNFKQIEDIIDSRKLLGQYNVNKQNNGVNYRYAYSNSTRGTGENSNRYISFEDMVLNEGDSLNNTAIKQTDSEITVMRVKCSDLALKRRKSKWDMHDIAIPGDGSHLGESPSLVNLVTLVGDNILFEEEEYLVPLSSWDPYFSKLEEFSPDMKCCSDSKLGEPNCSDQNITIDTLSEKNKQDDVTKIENLPRNLSKMEISQESNFISSENPDDPNETGYETILVILPSFFYTSLTLLLESSTNAQKKSYFVLEFLILITPMILGMTLLAEYTNVVLISLVAVFVLLLKLKYRSAAVKRTEIDGLQTFFITNARSTINTLSVIAILAVDFNVFPRHFAKTSNFGYSLMDTGVGLFLYSNGIVAPEAMNKKNSISKSLKSSLPLFVLGSARFILTKLLSYHVPISEYGVHWNFFITLGVTKIFTSFFLNVFPVKHIYISAILLITAHQVLLQNGLQKFVLEDHYDRGTFIKANKEGIVSNFGYVALYLFSVYFGYVLNLTKKNQTKYKLCLKIFLGAFLFLALSVVFQQFFGISRRLANTAYCFWILFIGIFMTGLFYVLQIMQESIFGKKAVYTPYIFEAVNYNGLVFFLVGNVLTGLVNMSMYTREKDNYTGVLVVTLYMLVNCGVVGLLYWKSWKLKL